MITIKKQNINSYKCVISNVIALSNILIALINLFNNSEIMLLFTMHLYTHIHSPYGDFFCPALHLQEVGV